MMRGSRKSSLFIGVIVASVLLVFFLVGFHHHYIYLESNDLDGKQLTLNNHFALRGPVAEDKDNEQIISSDEFSHSKTSHPVLDLLSKSVDAPESKDLDYAELNKQLPPPINASSSVETQLLPDPPAPAQIISISQQAGAENNVAKSEVTILSGNNSTDAIEPILPPPFLAKTFSGEGSDPTHFAQIASLFEEDFAKLKRNHERPRSETEFISDSPVQMVHRVLRTGLVAPTVVSAAARSGNIIEAVQDAAITLRPGLFLHHSADPLCSSTSAVAAGEVNGLSTLLFHYNSKPDDDCTGSIRPSNLLVSPQSMSSIVKDVFRPLNCLQVIDDLELFVADLLPFEFESFFSDLLCQCNMTYVPKLLPTNPYFTVWDSLENLLQSASLVPDAKCSLSILDASYSSAKYNTAARFSHTIITRNSTKVPLTNDDNFLSVADLSRLSLDKHSQVIVATSLTLFLSTESVATNANGTFNNIVWSGREFGRAEDFQKGKSFRKKQVDYSKSIPQRSAKNANRFEAVQDSVMHASVSTNATEPSSIISSLNLANSTVVNTTESASYRRRLYSTFTSSSSATFADKDSIGGPSERVLWLTSEASALDMKLSEMLSFVNAQKQEKLKDTGSSSASVSGGRAYMSKSSRAAQVILYETEGENYHLWMNAFRHGRLQNERYVREDFQVVQRLNGSVFFMGRDLSLFSTKLAMLSASNSHGKSNMMFVAMLTNGRVAESHFKLNTVMKLRNVLVSVPELTGSFVLSLAASHILSDLMFLEADVFYALLTQAMMSQERQPGQICVAKDAFLDMVSLLLSAARITYWRIPTSRALLDFILLLISNRGLSDVCKEVFEQAFSDPNILLQEIANRWSHRYTFAVDTVETVDVHHSCIYRFEFIAVSSRSSASHVQSIPKGLSLHAVTWLNVIPAQKRLMFNLLLQLPLWMLGRSSDADGSAKSVLDAISLRGAYFYINGDGRLEVAMHNVGHDGQSVGSKYAEGVSPEIATAQGVWAALSSEFNQHPAELANGRFSFLEYNSGLGLISSRLAQDYPDATIFSLEKDDKSTEYHLDLLQKYNLTNDAVCHLELDSSSLHRNLYESPELFRFQLFFNNALQQFEDTSSLDEWGLHMGQILSSALTTFVYVPNRSLLSLGLYALFGIFCDVIHFDKSGCRVLSSTHGAFFSPVELLSSIGLSTTFVSQPEDAWLKSLQSLNRLSAHPQRAFVNFHSDWLLSAARSKPASESSVLISPVAFNDYAHVDLNGALDFPMMRCDIVNMTRHVHHHFDYARDGHSRTYTMHIGMNQSLTNELKEKFGEISKLSSVVDREGVHLTGYENVPEEHLLPGETERQRSVEVTLPLGNHPCQHHATSVKLYRDKDDWPIPYTSIYGVTLITALRMGLKSVQRDRLFNEFLRLPLYEDMAPWNIVLMGRVSISDDESHLLFSNKSIFFTSFQSVDYIDYDTKDVTFDLDIPKAYQVRSMPLLIIRYLAIV